MNRRNIRIIDKIDSIPEVKESNNVEEILTELKSTPIAISKKNNIIFLDLNRIDSYSNIFEDSFSENADISLAIDLGLSDSDFEEFFDYESAAKEYIRDNFRKYRDRYMHEHDSLRRKEMSLFINEDDVIDEYVYEVAEDMVNNYSYYQYHLEPYLNSWELTLFLLDYLIENKQYIELFKNIDYITINDNEYQLDKVYISEKDNIAVLILK